MVSIVLLNRQLLSDMLATHARTIPIPIHSDCIGIRVTIAKSPPDTLTESFTKQPLITV